jgi:hypothetical protein
MITSIPWFQSALNFFTNKNMKNDTRPWNHKWVCTEWHKLQHPLKLMNATPLHIIVNKCIWHISTLITWADTSKIAECGKYRRLGITQKSHSLHHISLSDIHRRDTAAISKCTKDAVRFKLSVYTLICVAPCIFVILVNFVANKCTLFILFL